MRMRWIVCLMSMLLSGCGLIHQSMDVLSYKTAQALSDHKERKRNAKCAREAWKSEKKNLGALGESVDYADGFHEGFTELMFWGGNGEPPPMPPPKYRTYEYQSPQGYQAIQNWFAGYRHGAGFAMERRFRDWVTGPSYMSFVSQQP